MVNAKLQWDTRLLGQLIQSIDTGTSVRSRSSNSSYPAVLKTSALSFGRFDASERKAILSEDLDRRKCEIFAGDILISRMNTPDRVGATVFVESTPPNIFLPDRIWRVTTTTQADARWLCYALNFPPMSARIRGLGSGTSGSMKNIPKAKLLGVKVPFPPLSQQRAIADVLAGFDEHLTNLDALIAKKKAVRDSALEDLVTGRHRLDGSTSRWKTVRLSQLATLRHETLSATPDIDIELENLVSGEGRIIGDTTPRTSSTYSFRKGDVLFGRLRPYLKKYWLANCNGVRSGEIWALCATELIHPEFLFHLVQTRIFLSAANRATGTKMPRADWNILKDQTFLVPPLNEQDDIASLLLSMDAEIAALVEERAKVERLKQGAMEDLLTGRVRLLVHEEAS